MNTIWGRLKDGNLLDSTTLLWTEILARCRLAEEVLGKVRWTQSVSQFLDAKASALSLVYFILLYIFVVGRGYWELNWSGPLCVLGKYSTIKLYPTAFQIWFRIKESLSCPDILWTCSSSVLTISIAGMIDVYQPSKASFFFFWSWGHFSLHWALRYHQYWWKWALLKPEQPKSQQPFVIQMFCFILLTHINQSTSIYWVTTQYGALETTRKVKNLCPQRASSLAEAEMTSIQRTSEIKHWNK